MLTKQEIRNHYKNPIVINTIMRISSDEGSYRAGNWDFSNWYKYVNGKSLKLKLSNRVDYSNMILKGRSLYWTLNLFNAEIFQVNYNEVRDGESPKISRKYTTAYTFGIDIDRDHGKDIHDPVVKQSVEALAQYFTDKLREYAPNSVYVLYSGGGIYIMVHHKVFSKYYSKYLENSDPEHTWDEMLAVLGDAFDFLIGEFRDEFFRLHPECKGYVKPDQLNNSQRVFKTIFSVHKSLDYAVVPLDPENIKIDFERATIPLKPGILAEGEKWYTKYDDGEQFLNVLLKPFIEKAMSKKSKASKFSSAYAHASAPLEDISKWPPCMRNIYLLPKCGEGATRALANFASFLGQIGIEEEKAHLMFLELVDRWGARASNIFESYYRVMKVPTCESLNANPNIGFPKGVSIKNLGVCKPDARCVCVPSPRYYADHEADLKRLYAPSYTQHKPKISKLENKEKLVDSVTAAPRSHSMPAKVQLEDLYAQIYAELEDYLLNNKSMQHSYLYGVTKGVKAVEIFRSSDEILLLGEDASDIKGILFMCKPSVDTFLMCCRENTKMYLLDLKSREPIVYIAPMLKDSVVLTPEVKKQVESDIEDYCKGVFVPDDHDP